MSSSLLAPIALHRVALGATLPGIFVFVVVGAAAPSGALVTGFSDGFAPANWTVTADEAGFLDASGAPDSLKLQGPDDGSGDEKIYTFSIELPALNPAVGFRWAYTTADSSSSYDQFGYILNNTGFVNLSDPFGSLSQSGYSKIAANPTDTFAFALRSADGLGGAASVEIFSFQAGPAAAIPDCLPCVPAPLPLLAPFAAQRFSRRLRRLASTLRAA